MQPVISTMDNEDQRSLDARKRRRLVLHTKVTRNQRVTSNSGNENLLPKTPLTQVTTQIPLKNTNLVQSYGNRLNNSNSQIYTQPSSSQTISTPPLPNATPNLSRKRKTPTINLDSHSAETPPTNTTTPTTPLTEVTNNNLPNSISNLNQRKQSRYRSNYHHHTQPSSSQIFQPLPKTKTTTTRHTVGINLINKFSEPNLHPSLPIPSPKPPAKRRTTNITFHGATAEISDDDDDESNKKSDNDYDFDNFDGDNSDNSSEADNEHVSPTDFEGNSFHILNL
jgi:hypothetical protein